MAEIKILPVLAPQNTGSEFGQLTYSHKNVRAQEENRKLIPELWNEFEKCVPGSEEEEYVAKQLSMAYLGETALQIGVGSSDKETRVALAKQFTLQSLELYGEPDPESALTVIEMDMRIFDNPSHKALPSADKMVSLYQELGVKSETTPSAEETNEVDFFAETIGEVINDRFGFLLDGIDINTLYDASETFDLAQQMLGKLSASDLRWAEWTVETKDDGSMAVDTREKTVFVGKERAAAKGDEVGASLLHEFIVHALRSVNGEELDNERAEYGIPGYLDFEEGLGCYIEYALTGKIPAKIANREIGLALALGSLDGKRHDRHEVFEVLKARNDALMDIERIDDDDLRVAKTKELRTLIIDRLFRGGDGVGEHAAVFVKDKVYGEGFVKAQNYIEQQLKQGADPSELLKFLLCAKFDATNPKHVKQIVDLKLRKSVH